MSPKPPLGYIGLHVNVPVDSNVRLGILKARLGKSKSELIEMALQLLFAAQEEAS